MSFLRGARAFERLAATTPSGAEVAQALRNLAQIWRECAAIVKEREPFEAVVREIVERRTTSGGDEDDVIFIADLAVWRGNDSVSPGSLAEGRTEAQQKMIAFILDVVYELKEQRE